MKFLLQSLKKVEKIILVFLLLVAMWMAFSVAQAFYDDHSELLPVPGGDYVEGAVGQVDSLNPLFVQQGSVAHDISQLIFSGLTKYDPETGEIVPDLAEFQRSSNGKEYTFVIKEDAKWHDGQPVTADDVIFTYNTVIANPQFNGAILIYNDYSGVKVTKVDELTVQFLLEQPDSFFLVKTMVGLLPEHLLRDQPVESLDVAPFNFFPIGSGPYQFVSQNPLLDHTEYNLIAYEDYYGGTLSIETMAFKIFPTLEDLKANISALDGIRNLPNDLRVELSEDEQFNLVSYHLPQYVALFINNESDILEETKVRLALQLGTDKEEIAEELGQERIIDSPLLEIEQEDWRLVYSVRRANGALFDTQWEIPNKEAIGTELGASEDSIEDTVEQETGTEEVNYINGPNEGEDWTTAQSRFTLTGTAPEGIERIEIRGYQLQQFQPGDDSWSYKVDADQYENLFPGENIFEVKGYTVDGEERILDSITINYISQQDLTEEERKDIFLENQSAPPLPIRVNDKGQVLALDLITTERFESHQKIAQILEQQWRKIGVGVNIEVLDANTFQERLNARDYDLVILGQNLGYDLDAFSYWHSSQATEEGLNLSQFKNFIADSLLERARLEHNEEERLETLNELQGILTAEVPAIFLYSPTYHFAFSNKVQNATFNNLATTTDRLSGIQKWSSDVERQWIEGVRWTNFFSWMMEQF